ncbi:MAG: DUF4339 domain-containing protein [Planctomycetes bacterium]|nr:DUF4339 domain-containing protein [Planctomycetota bacterium]
MNDERRCWYVTRAGDTPTGPFTAEQIRVACRTRQLDSTVLCWCEGMAAWQPLAEVGAFVTAVSTSVAMPSPPIGSAAQPTFPTQQRWRPRARPKSSAAWLLLIPLGAVCLAGLIYAATQVKPTSFRAAGPTSAGGDIPIYKTGLLFGVPFGEHLKPYKLATGLDREAGLLAIKTWKLTKANDGFRVRITRTFPPNNSGLRGLPSVIPLDCVFELRNPHVMVASQGMTEADRLNGRGFHGIIKLGADAGRFYPLNDQWANGFSGRWSAWANGAPMFCFCEIAIEQRNGAWKILSIDHISDHDGFGRTISFPKPDGAVIPAR